MLETILYLAIAVERVTEIVFGQPFDKIEKLKPYKWTLMYVAMVLGVVSAFTFDLDFLTLVGQDLTLFGQVLTGIAIGGGSNFIHDWLPGGKNG